MDLIRFIRFFSLKLWNKKDENRQKVSLAFLAWCPYNSGAKWIIMVICGVKNDDRRIQTFA